MEGSRRGGQAVFRFRDLRFFLASRFLWGMAQQMLSLAIAWRVYDLTRDPLALGLIGLFAFAPALPLSFVTGAAADRYDRRRILILTCLALIAAVVAFLAAPDTAGVWPAYGLVLVIGASRAFSQPASLSLLANLVPEAEFSSATAWANTFNQTATILGPSVGGFLYPLGPRAPFIVALCCLLAALALNVMIARRPMKSANRPPVTVAVLLAGWRFIWSSPVLVGAMSLDLVAVFFGGATALLPIYASDIYHVGPAGLGLLRSSPAIGSIFAALILAHTPITRRAGPVMFGSVTAYGVATIGFGLSTHIAAGMFCLAILGSADVISVVIRQSLIQLDTPDSMRGRVAAVHNIVASASNNLGDLESGALAAMVGATPTIIFGGVCAVAASGAWMWAFPGLRRRKSLSDGAAREPR